MSRLRMASHRLHLETGRWISTDLTDRTCSYCNTFYLNVIYIMT